jgi:type II secretory ATPase GspE/PulE/Tfp pilus assembly ATPase PilB-like protein
MRGLGLDSLSIAESLVAVVSQRLVRTICPQCREEYTPSEAEARYLGTHPERLFRGRGCATCGMTGYLGRTLVYEIFTVSPELRTLLEAEAPLAELEAVAQAQGFRSMFQVGVDKALQGDTTVAELMRVLGTTRYAPR